MDPSRAISASSACGGSLSKRVPTSILRGARSSRRLEKLNRSVADMFGS